MKNASKISEKQVNFNKKRGLKFQISFVYKMQKKNREKEREKETTVKERERDIGSFLQISADFGKNVLQSREILQ